jgi:hypothetical protein
VYTSRTALSPAQCYTIGTILVQYKLNNADVYELRQEQTLLLEQTNQVLDLCGMNVFESDKNSRYMIA